MGLMLTRGAQFPHITLTSATGERIVYRDLWQRSSVAIVCMPDASAARAYADASAEFARRDALCIVTANAQYTLPCPGVVIVDRWGEIVHMADGVPAIDDVLDWLEHLEQRCPECEGEAR